MRERHRRDIVLKTDPVTREKYWSNEVVTVYKPDEGDRVNAVLDILKGVTTAEEVRKKFDIATVNSVYTWIGKYVTQEKALSLEEQSDEDMPGKVKMSRFGNSRRNSSRHERRRSLRSCGQRPMTR